LDVLYVNSVLPWWREVNKRMPERSLNLTSSLFGVRLSLQGSQKRLELLSAVVAAVQMLLDQRHSLGRVLACQVQVGEAVELLVACIAADLSQSS
jgi:hypothetical protein